MNEITIRDYHPSDLERCRALWEELTQHHREIYEDPGIGGDSPGLHFDKHLDRVGPERVWVAEQRGQVIGLAGLILDDAEAEVEPIVVAARCRGAGVGQALLGRLTEEAQKLDVRYLSVRPVARNVEAIAFFHGSGFQTLGHIELLVELDRSTPGTWKPGPELFGHSFRY
jgi:N-acetylglutamate synthase-like GNAT family acetyltransferase